jgi:hypothetical protein
LHAWVRAKGEELSETPAARAFARSGDRLAKKFHDEARPLALFAWCEFGDRSDVKVKPNLGNENFDGTISFTDGSKLFVEITYAKNGYDDSLRMEVQAREGHVNALAPVTVVGTRHSPNRRVQVPNEAVRCDVTRNEHLSYVVNCLKTKAAATYGPRHILVLVVDDYIPFHNEQDVKILDMLVTQLLRSLSLDFGRLVILGASGQLLISKPLTPRKRPISTVRHTTA